MLYVLYLQNLRNFLIMKRLYYLCDKMIINWYLNFSK